MKIFGVLLSIAIFILCYAYLSHYYGISLFDFLIANRVVYSPISLKKIIFVLSLPFIPFVYSIFRKKKYFIVLVLMMIPIFVDFFIFPEKTVEEIGFQGQGPFDRNSCYPSVEKDGIYLHACFCNTTNTLSKPIELPFWADGVFIKLCAGDSGGDGISPKVTFAGYAQQVYVGKNSCASIFFPKSGSLSYLKIESGVFGVCNFEDTIVKEILII